MMPHAIRLGRQGLGRTGANPSVGCVIVKDGRIITATRTADGGRPHAEALALEMAGADAKGAAAYVTLEPCAHEGETPSCARLLAEAGITKAVIGQPDPDPRTAGNGIALLQAAGIEVTLLNGAEAANLHRGFFSRIRRNRPWVTLKIASSADGFIATQSGESQWITGEAARQHGHLLRYRSDAILTGSGTYDADAPQLSCRLDRLEAFSPKRYVVSRNSEFVVRDSDWEVLHVGLDEALAQLAAQGVNHLMVEAGSALSGSFLREGLIDELYWYRAPMVLGSGLPALGGEWDSALADRPRAALHKQHMLDADTLTIYRFTQPAELLDN